jgi:hypothetical protein
MSKLIRKPFSFVPAMGGPRPNARQRVLAQWRGLNVTAEEVAQRGSARAVADVMPRVLKGIRFEHRQAEAQIVKVWTATVDPVVAAHARPVELHKGTLFVNVDSNVWLSEIVRYRRQEILKRLQHALGAELIQKISFRVG